MKEKNREKKIFSMEQALYIYHFKNLHKIVCVIVQVLINKKKYREKKNPVTFSIINEVQ